MSTTPALSVRGLAGLLVLALPACAKACWDRQYAERMCAWHETCDPWTGDDGMACEEHYGQEACGLGSAEQQEACLEAIEAATEDCSAEGLRYSETGGPCSWVLSSCWEG